MIVVKLYIWFDCMLSRCSGAVEGPGCFGGGRRVGVERGRGRRGGWWWLVGIEWDKWCEVPRSSSDGGGGGDGRKMNGERGGGGS